MRIVSLGDSVTAGVGDRPSCEGDLGWAAHLARSLGCREFNNLARVGARARDVMVEQLPTARRQRPDVATVLVGGNDALRTSFDAARVAEEVGTCAEELRNCGSDVVVVLLHDPQRVLPGGGWAFGRVMAERAREINEHIRAVAADIPGVIALDPSAYRATYEPRSWHIDRMHPSAHGHRALASAAGQSLMARGWTPGPVAAPPEDANSRWDNLAWLIRNGAPWFAKRSVDLLPELISVVLSERRSSLRACG